MATARPNPQQRTTLERFARSTRARVLGAALSASSLVMPEVSERPTAASAESGPSFGEEGFGDVENAPVQGPDQARTESIEGEQAPSTAESDDIATMEARRSGDLIRDRAASAQQTTQEESNASEGKAKSGAEDVFKKGVDKIVFSLAAPTFGLSVLLWLNTQFFVGDVIMGGKGKMIPALTWGSLASLAGANVKSAKVADAAAGQLLPKIALHILLIVIDLVIGLIVSTLLLFLFIEIYMIVRMATDPVGALVEFGSLI